MKKNLLFLCCILVFLNGFLLVSCASFKAQYTDQFIYAELEVEDNDYVILYFKNNTESTIKIIPDNCFYSNSGHSAGLIPLDDRFMYVGAKYPPINIPPNKFLRQKFVDTSAIKYENDFFNKGKIDSINRWTPRDEKEIINSYFSFEYEINGVTKQLVFEGDKFIKKTKKNNGT